MTRTHRMAHRLVWPVLALVVGILFVAALVMRPPPEKSAAIVSWVSSAVLSVTQRIYGPPRHRWVTLGSAELAQPTKGQT